MESYQAIVSALGMAAHPEGGWFVETWRADAAPGDRPSASAILYLLAAGERSNWHRVDAAEIWQWSGGEALELRIWADGDPAVAIHRVGPGMTAGEVVQAVVPAGDAAVAIHRLGPGMTAGEVVQAVVPAGAWQSARPLGGWTMVGCIVSPAFEYDGFELAAPDWEPPVP